MRVHRDHPWEGIQFHYTQLGLQEMPVKLIEKEETRFYRHFLGVLYLPQNFLQNGECCDWSAVAIFWKPVQ